MGGRGLGAGGECEGGGGLAPVARAGCSSVLVELHIGSHPSHLCSEFQPGAAKSGSRERDSLRGFGSILYIPQRLLLGWSSPPTVSPRPPPHLLPHRRQHDPDPRRRERHPARQDRRRSVARPAGGALRACHLNSGRRKGGRGKGRGRGRRREMRVVDPAEGEVHRLSCAGRDPVSQSVREWRKQEKRNEGRKGGPGPTHRTQPARAPTPHSSD